MIHAWLEDTAAIRSHRKWQINSWPLKSFQMDYSQLSTFRLLPVSCPDPLSPVAMCYWSSLCLTSVLHLMGSSPTTPASRRGLMYQQGTQKLVKGPSLKNQQSNPVHLNLLPPLLSHPPPLSNMCPLRDPNQSTPREAADRAPRAKTGRWSRQMAGGLVGEVLCALCVSLCTRCTVSF